MLRYACLADYKKETCWRFNLKPIRQMDTLMQNGRQACLADYKKETCWRFDLKPIRQMDPLMQNARQALQLALSDQTLDKKQTLLNL
ncbi:MAG: hypothetical protein R6U46_10145 [Marinilabilia sp.]